MVGIGALPGALAAVVAALVAHPMHAGVQKSGCGALGNLALNAANEEAVAAFLDRRLGFNGIGAVVEETLQRTPSSRCTDVDAVMDVDARARVLARSLIREWAC